MPFDKTSKSLAVTKDRNLNNDNYLNIVYSEARKPKNEYPLKLAFYLRDKVYKKTGKILDVGCGRGDMIRAFANSGFNVSGVDISSEAKTLCNPFPVGSSNLEKDPIPVEDDSFEFVFSKSLIEHLHFPMNCLKEAYRVLAIDGVAVVMTPSWVHNCWGPFYIDHTHVTPFTQPSLRDAMLMAGFQDVTVYLFHQLPFLWERPYLKPLIRTLALLPLRYSPMHDVNLPKSINILFRFSKEVMLMGVGRKV